MAYIKAINQSLSNLKSDSGLPNLLLKTTKKAT